MNDSQGTVAYIYAIEKKERNGKWKVRALEVMPDSSPVSPDPSAFRYKLLISASGPDFDTACDSVWTAFRQSAALRPYMAQVIRLS
jgi:hypothetical protein